MLSCDSQRLTPSLLSVLSSSSCFSGVKNWGNASKRMKRTYDTRTAGSIQALLGSMFCMRPIILNDIPLLGSTRIYRDSVLNEYQFCTIAVEERAREQPGYPGGRAN